MSEFCNDRNEYSEETLTDCKKAKKQEIKNNRKKIKEEYQDQIKRDKKEILKDISKEDRKTGGWFEKLIIKVLTTHAKNVNAEYFREKYKTSQKDIIAKKLIASYSKYNTAVGVVIGGAGGLGEIIMAVISTFPEIALVTYNQLKLIYDLCIIYEKPIDLEDPEDAFQVLLIVFNVKLSEVIKGGAKWSIDKGGKLFVEKAGKRVVMRKVQNTILNTMGKKITQRFIKNIIAKSPLLIGAIFGSAACGVLDYFSTLYVANRTLYYCRTGRLIIEYFEANDRIWVNINNDGSFRRLFRKKERERYIHICEVLAKGCWIMVNADSKVHTNKTDLIDYIYSTKPLEGDFIQNMKKRIKVPVEEFVNEFNAIELKNKEKEYEVKKTIFYAMKLVAISDHNISSNEIKILETISLFFGADTKSLKNELKILMDDVFKL